MKEMQAESEWVVIDRLSNNLLGEFAHRQHAEEFVHELAEANGSYAGLTIVTPAGTTWEFLEDE